MKKLLLIPRIFKQRRFINSGLSLASKHREFLSLVKDQGASDGGRINLAYISDKIADIKICNIGRKNAISGVMMNDLARIVDEVCSNKNLVGCIIRGEGDFFCSGADLSLARDIINTPEMGLRMSAFMTESLNNLRNSDIISLGMLNGPCLGGGSEISTVPDYRIMCSYSSSPAPYICFVQAKLGVSPGWGGANRLLSIIGRGNALRLLGSSMKVDADTALRIGFVEQHIRINGESDLLGQALQFFEPFVNQRFPDAVKATKKIIAACDSDGQLGSQTEMETFGQRWAGKDNSSAFSEQTAKK